MISVRLVTLQWIRLPGIRTIRTLLFVLCMRLCLSQFASVFNVKRFLGRKFSDEDVQFDIKQIPFQVYKGQTENLILG
jgi:hypothetical protein